MTSNYDIRLERRDGYSPACRRLIASARAGLEYRPVRPTVV